MCRYLFKLPLVIVLTGCATRQLLQSTAIPVRSSSGDATWRVVERENASHYQLKVGEVSSGAALQQRVAPVYPPALLLSCPRMRQIHALLIVNSLGHVSEVRVAGEIQSDESQRLLIAAVRAAAVQWTFQPLEFDRWADDADGKSHKVSSEARPFSEEYIFRFACRAGQADVSTDQAGAR